ASATFLASGTESTDATSSKDGLGGQAFYSFETKAFVFATQMEHYDTGFQMDTAFLNQVGITQGWSYLAPSIYPSARKLPWLKRVTPFVFARYGKDRIQHGDPWTVVSGVRMNFTRQGFFRADTAFGDEAWAGRTFRTSETRLMGEAQLSRWLHVFARTSFGDAIFYDPVSPYLGHQRNHVAELSLQPSARFNQALTYDRVEFDRPTDGSRVYTVNIVNTKTTFQLNRRFSVRAIVQYDSSQHRVLTDFLGSYELLPGTVAYAGYGSLIERRDWDGSDWTSGAGRYRTSERGFFFKASYIHRF
ncbi:MAG TPA: hypothetical protein VMV21_08855, partial [Vicinamibacteria bacterium]|nr:hypothetical protein [Vicinamibacteria bacterium]